MRVWSIRSTGVNDNRVLVLKGPTGAELVNVLLRGAAIIDFQYPVDVASVEVRIPARAGADPGTIVVYSEQHGQGEHTTIDVRPTSWARVLAGADD